MSRRKKTDGVQDALIPDEMSPLKLLDFNAGNAKIKQAAVDLRRSVNTAKPMSSKTEYLAKFQHIDAVTEADLRRGRARPAHRGLRRGHQPSAHLSARGPTHHHAR